MKLSLQFFGGNGASLTDGTYGKWYKELVAVDNLKIVTQTMPGSTRTPMVSKVPGRVYAVQDKASKEIKSLTFHDENGYRYKQVDLSHAHPVGKVTLFRHTHVGYRHDEYGTRKLSTKERRIVAIARSLNRSIK